jgi:signal transduction histidine kinase
MPAGGSPTVRLLSGLAVTVAAVVVYSSFTIRQIRGLEQLESQTIDRSRADSLLLLRIQNDLHSVALAMRDMLDAGEPYPLTAWRAPFRRLRTDLDDALAREAKVATSYRAPDEGQYLATSFAQFWDSLDRVFALAESGHEAEAREQVRLSLQSRHAALSTAVARLLVRNNENDQQAAGHAHQIYSRVERNVYLFLGAILTVVLATSLYLVHHNRRMFRDVAAVSQQRSELARQLISIQENTFRYISRELHDEFGQILTGIGAMLQSGNRRRAELPPALREDLQEIREIVQSTLEKTRSLSRALHPVVLEEAGFEPALHALLPAFEKQTGVEIRLETDGQSVPIHQDVAIHLYRVLQEALNNIARHAHSAHAVVRLRYAADEIVLEVEDDGVGLGGRVEGQGMGLVSMRERAGLVSGRLDLIDGASGGVLVRFTVPLRREEAHAGA